MNGQRLRLVVAPLLAAGLGALACAAHAQLATAASAASAATTTATASAPLWILDYHDCTRRALSRRVPNASSQNDSLVQPVAQTEHECADRLPTPGPTASQLSVDAVVAAVHADLMRYFYWPPVQSAAGPRRTLQVGHGVTCPQPEYPKAALRAEVIGKTQLELRVDANGHVVSGDVIVASGPTREHRMLDGTALEAFAQCAFPASATAQRMRMAFEWRIE